MSLKAMFDYEMCNFKHLALYSSILNVVYGCDVWVVCDVIMVACSLKATQSNF